MNKYNNPWNLTPAQVNALAAVCDHGCHKEAAKHLGVSLKTLQTQVEKAGIRMGERSRIIKYILFDRWRFSSEGTVMRASNNAQVEISCKVIRTTAAAVLIEHEGKGDVWLPISQISDWTGGPDKAPGMDTTSVFISEWLATSKGLV